MNTKDLLNRCQNIMDKKAAEGHPIEKMTPKVISLGWVMAVNDYMRDGFLSGEEAEDLILKAANHTAKLMLVEEVGKGTEHH